MTRNAMVLAIVSMAASILLAGCGYRAGFLMPSDVRSVNVRVTENQTFWHEAVKKDNLEGVTPRAPGVEPAYVMAVELTERLKNELVRRTALKMEDADRADSVLETTITGVEPAVLLRGADDEVVAERVIIRVDFVWRDRRNGRILAAGKGVSRPTDFMVPLGESFTTGTRRSFDYVARSIVEQMQEGF